MFFNYNTEPPEVNDNALRKRGVALKQEYIIPIK